ncbi:hypothetical protein NQD34_010550, partial [Periophthalmus magnuspinnatus]
NSFTLYTELSNLGGLSLESNTRTLILAVPVFSGVPPSTALKI